MGGREGGGEGVEGSEGGGYEGRLLGDGTAVDRAAADQSDGLDATSPSSFNGGGTKDKGWRGEVVSSTQ